MNELFTTLKRTGVFGGPAKIHQMFEDYRNPETAPMNHAAELAILAVSAIAAVACWMWIKDDPSTKR